jgi:hypothetical protein
MNIVQNIEQDVEKAVVQFGTWIEGEFNAAEKVYDTLTDAEKQAANWGYGVLAVVNANLDKDGALIIPMIQKAFPALDLDNLHGFIDILLNNIKAVQAQVPLTLTDGLNLLVAHMSQFSGNFWKLASQSIGTELTIIISPESTVQKIVSSAELIYQVIIKPLIAKL